MAASVLDLVPNVPTSISGTRLLEIADRKREFVQNYTGITIGSNSIDIKYQDVIVNLSAAQTLKNMMLTGADAGNIRIGDFSINKGASDSLSVSAERLEADAMFQLKSLGRKITFKKALG